MTSTTIRFDSQTREKLKELGQMEDTYDDIINRIHSASFHKKVEHHLLDISDSISVEDMKWS